MQHTLVTTLVTRNSVYTFIREEGAAVGELVANTGTFAGSRWIVFTWDLLNAVPGQPIVLNGIYGDGEWREEFRSSTIITRTEHAPAVCISEEVRS